MNLNLNPILLLVFILSFSAFGNVHLKGIAMNFIRTEVTLSTTVTMPSGETFDDEMTVLVDWDNYKEDGLSEEFTSLKELKRSVRSSYCDPKIYHTGIAQIYGYNYTKVKGYPKYGHQIHYAYSSNIDYDEYGTIVCD